MPSETAPTIIRAKHVAQRTGLPTAVVYRLAETGAENFPSALRITERTLGFRSDEIDAWIESRQRVRA